MPEFKEVFSTTWKVLIALFVISLGLGLAYFIIGAIGESASRVSIPSNEEAYAKGKEYYDKKADEKHTRLPQSQWNKIIAAAIKQHCPLEGMTKEEAAKAMGSPMKTSSSDVGSAEERSGILGHGETWHYERTTHGKCNRHNGDDCATFYLSPNGYLTYPFQGGWLSLNCFERSFSPYRNQIPD